MAKELKMPNNEMVAEVNGTEAKVAGIDVSQKLIIPKASDNQEDFKKNPDHYNAYGLLKFRFWPDELKKLAVAKKKNSDTKRAEAKKLLWSKLSDIVSVIEDESQRAEALSIIKELQTSAAVKVSKLTEWFGTEEPEEGQEYSFKEIENITDFFQEVCKINDKGRYKLEISMKDMCVIAHKVQKSAK